MSDIPSEVHREILLRLPAASLFRFRAVCKAWRRTIDDPSFVKSHTTNNQRSSPTLLIRTSTGTLYSLSLDSLNYINGEQTIDLTHVKNLVRQGVPRLPDFPVASCNGLILISHYDINKIWVIWNPLTGDFHELPHLDIEARLIGSGIGYDSASDDYKVVRIDQISRQWGSQGVFLNGALHWRSHDTIVTLGLATEEYRQLALPTVGSLPIDMRLDALDGCLVLSDDYLLWRAWVMRDYGAEDPSWVELFSSKERSVIGGSSGCLWPVAYLKSERRLILQHDNKIIRWDIEKYSVRKVTIHGPSGFKSSQICPGSLFRFNYNGGGVGGSIAAKRTAGVKRKRNKASKRLKFSATITDSGCLSDSDYYSSEGEEDDY